MQPLTPDSTYTYSLRSMGGAAGPGPPRVQMGNYAMGRPIVSSTLFQEGQQDQYHRDSGAGNGSYKLCVSSAAPTRSA